ncbi:MAG: porin family protein [Gemmatimonadetes bacterium]|nr:porin family protein [Gemmatimonadota bacterium]
MKTDTRRRVPVLVAVAIFLLASPSVAGAQIGVVGGYNRDTIEEFLPENGFDFTDRTDGFHIGIFFNVNVGPIGIRPAVIYHRVPDLVATAGESTTQFDVELVEIPLDVRLRFPVPLLRPYFLAGPVFSFPSTSVTSVNDLLNDRPIRLEVGAGLELDLGFKLWPEIRYGRGIEPLMRPAIPIGASVLRGQGEPRLDTFTVRLGISF